MIPFQRDDCQTMAKNDLVLLDALLSQLPTHQSDPGQVFEQFVLDQVLKNYDLTKEEVDSGWTDGSAEIRRDGDNGNTECVACKGDGFIKRTS